MKYLKKFENISDDPEVGDYVICDEVLSDIYATNFIKNNIGIIIGVPSVITGEITYAVKYENVPRNIEFYFWNDVRGYYLAEIRHWSKNKEDLEQYITATKYNL